MTLILATILVSAACGQTAAAGTVDLPRELQKDVVLRALVDELERGKTDLKLADLPRPYFLEYALMDGESATATASLGSVTSSSDSRSRRLRTAVRVGSYELDNTNFGGGRGFMPGGRRGGSALPIEDDYLALRQAIWWATDRGYKDAVEALEQKKAFMETKIIEDKPHDFSKEKPTVHLANRIEPSVMTSKLETLARELSTVFLDYPDLLRSSVTVESGAGNKYIVNSEGTRLRVPAQWCMVTVSGSVQADDGMQLEDAFTASGSTIEALGTLPALQQRCRDLAEQLVRLRSAPVLESYAGPVLFDAEPAAEIFARRFARRLAGGQRPVGSRRGADDFAKRLNKRVLPRTVTVVDNPSLQTIEDQPCMGHYVFDDEGVQARPVTLIENGRLKAMVMSRNPSKDFARSTGHGRGLLRPRSTIGCVTVTASDAADPDALRAALIEACEDEDLDYGIRVAALGTVGSGGGGGRAARLMRGSRFRPSGAGSSPLVVYRVYRDGREELVRGIEIAQLDRDAFKRILAFGETPYVYNGGSGMQGYTVAAPAMLFEELDLTKIDEDFDRPPVLTNPLVRDTASAGEKDTPDAGKNN
jgi:predicted Zn-dependent protease